MGLGEIWDYFMRRKLLLLSVIVASAMVVFLSCKICFGRADESVSTPAPEPDGVAEIEIPKTGEIAELIEVAQCGAESTDWSEITLGNGENSAMEASNSDSDSEITFWGAEAPAAMIKPDGSGVKDGGKTEAVIITLGILAEVAILGAGKFIFDRYVR